MLMRSNDGRINHGVLIVGICTQVRKDPCPNTGPGPPTPAPMGVFPVAKAFGQVTPRNSGTIPVQHRVDKPTIVRSSDTTTSRATWEEILDAIPLIIA